MIEIYPVTISRKWWEIDTPMDLERAKYTALFGRFFEKN